MTNISLFMRHFKREFLIQSRQIKILVNSCLFFLMFLFFFPLTLKPELQLMRNIAPGLIWMGFLLAILFAADRLFTQDHEQGVLEQWLISGFSLPCIVAAKVIAYWLFYCMPLLGLSCLASLFFSFSSWETLVLVISLFCGTPALFVLCALASSFGIGIQQKGALMALILLPLTLPLLIFGSASVYSALQGITVNGYFALLLAISILAVAFLPFAIAGVIRIYGST